DLSLRDVFQRYCPEHTTGNESTGFFSCGTLVLAVHERAMLAEIDHLEEIRGKPRADQELPVGGLVDLWSARGDHDAVDTEFRDVPLDDFLPGITTKERECSRDENVG
nr:hypothetical protein [Candidatus Sigynarchaeota archaeon]